MRQSSKTALGGIIAALSVTIMAATTVVPFLSYALPAISGALLIIMVIEINRKWAFGAYISVSVLSFFILTDKEAAIMYAAFFGYYPIIKSALENRLPRVLEYLVKFSIFNVAVVSAVLIIVYAFKIPIDDVTENMPIYILLIMANAMFLLYDYTLTQTVELYNVKYRKRFRKIFK